jgi:uncharacterized membrane protein YfcA
MQVLLGCFIGLVIGVTGIGGGMLTTPLLILVLGLSPAQSVGTALIFSSVVKVNAILLYLRRREVDFTVLKYMLAGGLPGAAMGAFCLQRLALKQSNGMLLTIVGVIVMVSAACNAVRAGDRSIVQPARLVWLPVMSAPVGVLVGFSSVGAGALGTVLLFGLTKLAPAAVVGTDLLFGLLIAAVGGGLFVAGGNWNSLLLLNLLAGGLVGASVGSYVTGVLPSQLLRRLVLMWAFALGILLLYKGLGR